MTIPIVVTIPTVVAIPIVVAVPTVVAMASELLRKVLNYSVTDISQHQQDSNGHHSARLHNGYPGETGENTEEVCSSYFCSISPIFD